LISDKSQVLAFKNEGLAYDKKVSGEKEHRRQVSPRTPPREKKFPVSCGGRKRREEGKLGHPEVCAGRILRASGHEEAKGGAYFGWRLLWREREPDPRKRGPTFWECRVEAFLENNWEKPKRGSYSEIGGGR